MGKSVSLADRLMQANQIHNNKYGYPELENPPKDRKITINNTITIVCPKHGDFPQALRNHLVGKQGCPTCAKESRGASIKEAKLQLKAGLRGKATYSLLSSPESIRKLKLKFIDKAVSKYGTFYTFENLTYNGVKELATITCPLHGDFAKTPNAFLQGSLCPKCSYLERTKTLEEFIDQGSLLHDSFYTYEKAVYVTYHEKVIITCPKHGDFKQAPAQHLSGVGCRTCGYEKLSRIHIKSLEQFVKESNLVHDNFYSYEKAVYKGIRAKLEIVCPKHGSFWQTPDHHLNAESGCRHCATTVSKGHQQVNDFLEKELGITNLEVNTREYIGLLEIDTYLPEYNLAIEFDGIYKHSFGRLETTKERFRHFEKQNRCLQLGFNLFQIHDTEWFQKKEIVKSMIRNKLGIPTHKIPARKCTVERGLDRKTFQNFIKENHLQGIVEASVRYGLYYQENLVAVLGFSSRKGLYSLERFCSQLNTIVVGGFSKLLAQARKDLGSDIVTFSDRRYATGNLYLLNGFEKVELLPPDIAYVKQNKIINRQHLQKQKLPKLLGDLYNPNITEAENLFNNGYRRLWGSGKIKWILRKENLTSYQV